MFWTQKIADEIEASHPEGEIVVSSGVSPSGKYHVGTLREVLTADAVAIELKKRGREVRHIHFVDDLDFLRKIPSGVDSSFEQYLGKSLCDVPSPDGAAESYADYYLDDFLPNLDILGVDVEVRWSHKEYRSGFFVPAIEKTLLNLETVKKCLAEVSGRELNDDWSPIQVLENGYLKKRKFLGINTDAKIVKYQGVDGSEKTVNYNEGQVKLDWRMDWPSRWWLLGVQAEPFGRDHATKGGSYDTGKEIAKNVFEYQAPYPVPYEFINRAGETKKMSKSSGNTVNISDLLSILPPEIVRFFVLRYAPEKMLFFDQQDGVVRLIDEYAELLAKPDKNDEDLALLHICNSTLSKNTISNVPFSHLVASYQSALKDYDKTIDIIKRTEHAEVAGEQAQVIKDELNYIDSWLKNWAPENVKFSLRESVSPEEFSEIEKEFLTNLASQISDAPEDADGQWFHQCIYQFKTDEFGPKQMFQTLYKVIIGKDAGPRAGWFLSILPRDWLIARLKLDK